MVLIQFWSKNLYDVQWQFSEKLVKGSISFLRANCHQRFQCLLFDEDVEVAIVDISQWEDGFLFGSEIQRKVEEFLKLYDLGELSLIRYVTIAEDGGIDEDRWWRGVQELGTKELFQVDSKEVDFGCSREVVPKLLFQILCVRLRLVVEQCCEEQGFEVQ
jgi:hypothetical protein